MRKRRDGSYTEKARYTVSDDATIPGMLRRRAQARPGDVVAERRSGVGASRPVTAAELRAQVDDAARGLIALGVRPGDSVAVLSSTSYEWMVLDLAILTAGAVTVPIYESDSAAQIRHILTDADVVMAVTATSQQADLVRSVRARRLRTIVSLDRGALRALTGAAQEVSDADLEARFSAAGADDLATIIYTSGTTGVPKGVELTHRNFVGTTEAVRQVLGEVVDSPGTRLLLFLPLAHVLARFVMHAVLSGRGRLGFSSDVSTLLPDLQAFQPTVLIVVPRVLEKVLNAASARAGTGIRRRVFSWSARQARRQAAARDTLLGPSLAQRVRHRIADRLVLRRVREVLGPRLRVVVSGGAPLADDLGGFFSGIGITLLQGYGLSETTGPIAVQRLGANPVGTVGQILPGNAVRVGEDGEILLSGVSVMRGYHRLPEATAQVLEDGWFHTGDLGGVDRRGHLRITGRKKELIVTAGGKNVSPEILEDALQTHPLISHVIVVGDARPYIAALITLDTEMLPVWLTAHHLPVVDAAQAADMPEVRESLDRAIARANKQVSRAESIRRFRIVDAVFTVENGYLTPSLKLKRNAVLRDLAPEIDTMYAQGEAEKAAGRLTARRRSRTPRREGSGDRNPS
ncbi:AMP-dependent synthetase/ligase [Schaalia naturae]|uniref:AMP-dependent synthetase/ligase n=2 Tax=Schaalia naturae TaxID=635203 RepID=A0ABW2SKV3_9ACTO